MLGCAVQALDAVVLEPALQLGFIQRGVIEVWIAWVRDEQAIPAAPGVMGNFGTTNDTEIIVDGVG